MPGWLGEAKALGQLAFNPLTYNAAKYVGVPMVAGGAMYALNRPPGSEHSESLRHKSQRMQEGWLTGGGLSGAAIGHALTRGGSGPVAMAGILGGAALGAGLGYEYGTPMTAQYAWKHRMARMRYPGGIDSATGLPAQFSPASTQVDPNVYRRMSRWGI